MPSIDTDFSLINVDAGQRRTLPIAYLTETPFPYFEQAFGKLIGVLQVHQPVSAPALQRYSSAALFHCSKSIDSITPKNQSKHKTLQLISSLINILSIIDSYSLLSKSYDQRYIIYSLKRMDIIAKHKPFKSTGDDFASSNPLFAFYFYKYYLSVIKPILEQSKDAGERAELEAEIKETFKTMTKLANENGLNPNDETSTKAILEYTELMFAKNDHYHQQGAFTKQIAEDYLTIYRLYEVVGRFGKLDDGQNKRRVYSKKKFIDIMKELKKNPALQNASPQEVKKSVAPGSQLPPPPPPPAFQEKKIEKIQQEIKKSQFKPLPKASKLISFDKIQMQIEANKGLENAISELSFDRFKHARDEIMHVLELLDQIIDN